MFAYLLRRIVYAIPVLLGVNFITFALFFIVNTPDDMARSHLGHKYVTQESIENWKQIHGYDKPLFYNTAQSGIAKLTDTLFVDKTMSLFVFDFGLSDSGRNIGNDIRIRMWPSLMIAVPVLFLGIFCDIVAAIMMIFFRYTYLENFMVVLSIMMMSISGLFYIITGQFYIAKMWHWLPISGYDDDMNPLIFLILPVLVSVLAGIGAGTRWYRTLFLEELGKDYVRTAKAKGLSPQKVLFSHVLSNAMIPILTGVVVLIPSLFMGSLILESFFCIPGLGSYTIDAITQQDFAVVRAMVFLGSVMYILGLILTDISYTLVDPRIRLQ